MAASAEQQPTGVWRESSLAAACAEEPALPVLIFTSRRRFGARLVPENYPRTVINERLHTTPNAAWLSQILDQPSTPNTGTSNQRVRGSSP